MNSQRFRLTVGWLPRLALALAMALAAAACARPTPPAGGQPSVAPAATGPASSLEPELTLTLVQERQSYRIGEPVRMDVTLRNGHPFPLVVSHWFAFSTTSNYHRETDLDVILIGPDGNRVERPFHYLLPPKDEDFTTLRYGQTVGSSLELTVNYGRLQPGTYSLQLIYTNAIDAPDGREAWKGTLESNVLTFTIEP